MSAEQTPDIAAVLAEHLYNGCTDPACDPGSDPEVCIRRPFLNHVAAALAPVLDAAVREAEQRALREAAAGMSDDIWRGTGPDLHQDYFPAVNSIRVWLHDRAGRVAEPQHEAATSGKESESA